jgi:hypothetical protein
MSLRTYFIVSNYFVEAPPPFNDMTKIGILFEFYLNKALNCSLLNVSSMPGESIKLVLEFNRVKLFS